MNKEELQNRISEVEKMLCELKDELEDMEEKEVEKGKIWEPAYREEYWYIDCCGGVHKDSNFNIYSDKNAINIGNCYPTKEKAEFEANREKYTRLFRQYVEQHSEPLDWEDEEQRKYYCYYNLIAGEIFYDYRLTNQCAFAIYASSEEVLQEAIDFIGKKNFLEFVMEVKEK